MTEGNLCLSWDDGHPADGRVAELMQCHGLRGTFFVPLSNVEGLPVLSGRELRQLAVQGFEIGGHGLDHRRLTSLPRAAAKRQIVDGKSRLEDMLGAPLAGFCYPGGRHDGFIRQVVAESGFRYGRTTAMFHLTAGHDPYRMPTTGQLHRHDGSALLRNWLRQGAGAGRLVRAVQQWQAADLAAHYAGLAGRVAQCQEDQGQDDQGKGVLHLWGHSWEIAAAESWDWLDGILAAIAAVPNLRRTTCAELWP